MEFLAALENSALGIWLRESPSIWSYPTVLFLHTIGLGFLVGASAAVDFRILGFGSRLPLAPMAGFFPVMWLGFAATAVSGVALVIADATSFLSNPVFYVKLGFIALAVVTARLIRSQVFGNPLAETVIGTKAKVLAAVSLVFWTGAIVAGRLTAYLFANAGIEGVL